MSGCLKILVVIYGSLFLDFFKSFAFFNTGILKNLISECTSMLRYSEIKSGKTILSSWDDWHLANRLTNRGGPWPLNWHDCPDRERKKKHMSSGLELWDSCTHTLSHMFDLSVFFVLARLVDLFPEHSKIQFKILTLLSRFMIFLVLPLKSCSTCFTLLV